MKQDILLVGTGALSTLFAARLSEAGHHVSMLGTWKDGLQSLNQNGARVTDANGHERAFQVHATDNPGNIENVKHAIVLVKSWQTKRVAEKLKGILAPDGIVLTLQNGLGNRETLARDLGAERVALGVTTTGATLLGPGLVKVGGEGVISLEQNQALGPLEAALRSSNFNLQIVNDAWSLIWGKLIINAAINPLTALLQVPNGELLAQPWARKAMSALAREAAEVAQAEQVNLPFGDPIEAVEEVARKTAKNLSSMFQDVQRGAPTEIDAICGAIVKVAEKHNMPAPLNWKYWQLVKAL